MKPLLALLFGSVFFLGACSKKPGESCSGEGEAQCKGEVALTCQKGKWTEIPCRGPKGCAEAAAVVDCDNSFAMVDDACDEEGNAACSVDKKSALKCANGKWAKSQDCKTDCSVSGTSIRCD